MRSYEKGPIRRDSILGDPASISRYPQGEDMFASRNDPFGRELPQEDPLQRWGEPKNDPLGRTEQERDPSETQRWLPERDTSDLHRWDNRTDSD